MDEMTVGRRERKKAATHRALADAALRLFLERGFDQVSVKDVADAADVSTTTLFKHYPSKEALLFDEADDRERELVGAIEGRPEDGSVVEALRAHFLQRWSAYAGHPGMDRFTALTRSTPSLAAYGRSLWTRHEVALAQAIAKSEGLPIDDAASAALARFVLEIPDLTRSRDDGEAALGAVFDLLERGWSERAT